MLFQIRHWELRCYIGALALDVSGNNWRVLNQEPARIFRGPGILTTLSLAAMSGSKRDSDPESHSDENSGVESEYFQEEQEDNASISADEEESLESSDADFVDPHVEKNFAIFLPQMEKKASWTQLFVEEKLSKRITKVYGQAAEKAASVLAYAPKFKPKLHESWKKSVEAETNDLDDLFLPFQQEILGPLSAYQDVYLLDMKQENEDEYRRLVMLHAMNHVMKIRDRVLHHNQASAVAAANGKSLEGDEIMLDQGFTRPRVLILCPMRNIAFDLVEMIGELWTLSGAGMIDGMKRFVTEFGPPRDEDGDLVDETGPDPSKPADFNRTFRDNIDDCFRIGIKFTRKSMKLFSDFYSSDIIIASPLGLRLVIDGQNEKVPKGARNAKAKRARKADADFLASINICLLDSPDIMMMQNWDHLEYVLGNVNAMPVEAHDCDFSRVQTAYLDRFARKIRQTLCISKFAFPELNALLSKPILVDTCLGKWSLGSTSSTTAAKKASQFIDSNFHLFKPKSLEMQPDERLAYFTKMVLPSYAREDHICIFISSYFEFCQLKQWFTESDLRFACLSEYDEGGAITGARAKFFNGHAKFLLITERFHFYRRIHIRGVKHLLWYSLPEHAEYFNECASWVGDIYPRSKDEGEQEKWAPKTDSPVLYCPFDVMKVERIVGSSKIDRLF